MFVPLTFFCRSDLNYTKNRQIIEQLVILPFEFNQMYFNDYKCISLCVDVKRLTKLSSDRPDPWLCIHKTNNVRNDKAMQT